jgi:AraC-like DNA-binding protein/FixJ family two-component response regulator
MKQVSQSRVSFDKLSSLFTRTSDNRLLLHTHVGEGSIQYFKPEKGLQVNVWNCLFSKGIELYNSGRLENKQQFFTLAYIPDRTGLEIFHKSSLFEKSIPWNSLFVSTVSDFRLVIAPATRYRCITVSFSGDWLLRVLQTSQTLQDTIGRVEKLEKLQNITQEERKVLEELLHGVVSQQYITSFHIKTVVLKLMCDFLYRIKGEQPSEENSGIRGTLDKVEQYLDQHITKEFAGTKALAEQFSISESTLKRHFRKKYGVTISAYITSKKMQYARGLVGEKGMTIAEASRMVGYRSVQNFKEVFSKHFKSMLMVESAQKVM